MSKKKTPVKSASTRKPRVIEPHRHCPLCWNGSGGYGVSYSTEEITATVSTRYYKCVKTTHDNTQPCGFTWSTTVKSEVVKVEHRTVELDRKR